MTEERSDRAVLKTAVLLDPASWGVETGDIPGFRLRPVNDPEELDNGFSQEIPRLVLMPERPFGKSALEVMASLFRLCSVPVPAVVFIREENTRLAVDLVRAGAQNCIVMGDSPLRQIREVLEESYSEDPDSVFFPGSIPELKHREELFRSIVEHSQNAVLLIDRISGRYLYMNTAAEELAGYSLDELRGICSSYCEADAGHEKLASFRVIGDMKFRHRDGSIRVSRVSVLPFNSHLAVNIGTDISSHLEAEKALQRSLQISGAINGVLRAVNSGKTMDEVYAAVHESISPIIDTSNFFIALHDSIRGIITFPYFIDQKDNVSEIVSYVNADDNNSLTAGIIKSGKSIFLDEEGLKKIFETNASSYLGTLSRIFLGVPLKVQEDVIGAIAVQNYDNPDAYTHEDLAFMETLSETVAPAFERMITRQKLDRAEAGHRMLSKAIEQSPVSVIITDIFGNIEYVNKAFTATTGYEFEEVLERNPRILNSGTHDKEFYDNLWKTVSSGRIWSADIHNKAKDGRLFWEKATIMPIFDHEGNLTNYMALKEDVTEIREVLEKVDHTHDLYRDAIRNSRGAVYILDLENDKYDYIDDLIQEFIGPEAGDLTPRTLRSRLTEMKIADPDHRDMDFPDYSEAFLNGIITRYNADIRISTGTSHRWLFDCSLPLEKNDKGRVIRTLGILQDITDRVNALENQRLLSEQLRQSQKLEGLGQLAGGVAHDFNNILTASMGFTQLLLTDLQKGTMGYSAAEQLQQTHERARNLVRQLLAFSRKEANSPVPLNLNGLLRDLNKMLRRIIGEDIEMKMDISEKKIMVYADPSQIEQIIINLCVNSRDALRDRLESRKQENFIHISLDSARPDSDQELLAGVGPGEFARIIVKDNGAGMDEKILARIFDPFFTTKEAGKGTGLGLSTVYGIIRQNGGHVKAESRPGEGSTFTVYWPFMQTSARETNEEKKTSWTIPASGSEHILLAEDDEMVCDITSQALRKMGYSVTVCRNGQEAFQLASDPEFTYDLLITDLTMPKMGGRELVKALRLGRPDLKVIYCSGYTEELANRERTETDRAPLLGKPFTIQELGAITRRVLDG